MSSSPASAKSRAEALPECEPPRTTFGAPITVAMPASREAAAASSVVGNSAIETPSRCASATSSSVVSSWLARVSPWALAISTMRGRFASARSRPTRWRSRTTSSSSRLRLAGLAAVVDEVLVEVAELALAGRVVHQRNQPGRVHAQGIPRGIRRRWAKESRSADGSGDRRAAGPPRAACSIASARTTTCSPTPPLSSYSSMPTRKESNTVVMPAAAICAS